MTITTLNVPTLKAVKNAVIGNRTAKGSYGRDEVFVARYAPAPPWLQVYSASARLVECLNDPPALGETEDTRTNIRIEAAHIIASLSYGTYQLLPCIVLEC